MEEMKLVFGSNTFTLARKILVEDFIEYCFIRIMGYSENIAAETVTTIHFSKSSRITFFAYENGIDKAANEMVKVYAELVIITNDIKNPEYRLSVINSSKIENILTCIQKQSDSFVSIIDAFYEISQHFRANVTCSVSYEEISEQ